jgi:LPS-assembly lipoprotein
VNVEQALDVASQSQSGSTLRYNVVGAAGWQLTAANGTVWGSGQVEGFTSYAATGSTVATQSAATDAVGRLMTILADKVVTQLMLLDLPQ